MDVNHFNDERVDEIMLGSTLTDDERNFLVNDTPRFEECEFTRIELSGLSDKDLMSAAYSTWADYARNQS